ncbi:MAG TPA: hypothetical protein VGE04_15145, partial [Chloroflexia bacterium]
MVISLRRQSQGMGPQLGPDPAWARFYRTGQAEGVRRVKVQAYKPDITAYRVLGDCPDEVLGAVDRVRNRYNSSVYVAHIDSFRARPNASTVRLPVVGEIAAGQYDVTVAYQEYDCLDYEGGIAVDRAMSRNGA